MNNPLYVSRFVRVTHVIEILSHYPDGMSLADIASDLDTDVAEVRAEIRAYYAADVGIDQLAGGFHEPVIEFVEAPGGEHSDPATADYVRLRDLRPAGVGTKFMSLGELAQVSRVGHYRSTLESDNHALAEGLDILDHSILSGVDTTASPWLANIARSLRQAAEARQLVRILYARTWKPGIVERVIAPYRITHTRRGWEVDAGVAGSNDVRTYLVSGIQRLETLDETFEVPDRVDDLVEANRRLQSVVLIVPHRARWTVEAYAEAVDVLDEDEESLKLRADVLPPADTRIGLLLTSAGPDAFVLEPRELRDAGRNFARTLMQYHRRRPGADS